MDTINNDLREEIHRSTKPAISRPEGFLGSVHCLIANGTYSTARGVAGAIATATPTALAHMATERDGGPENQEFATCSERQQADEDRARQRTPLTEDNPEFQEAGLMAENQPVHSSSRHSNQ